MKPREEITTSVNMPPVPAKRLDAASKAEQLLSVSQHPLPASTPRSGKTEEALPKITGRVFPEQLRWVKDEIRSYRARHPRRPKLTIDLVMRVALDHLKNADSFDSVVHKHLN
jgi:hypothetical protein